MSKKRKVLIVEDELAMANALSMKLKKNHHVIIAHDGEEGYELALKEKPDLIISDIIMPKLDGMGLMKKIREDEKWGFDVPMIMLTNINDPLHVAEAGKYGVFDFLVKTDWKLEDIADIVKNKIDRLPEDEEDKQ